MRCRFVCIHFLPTSHCTTSGRWTCLRNNAASHLLNFLLGLIRMEPTGFHPRLARSSISGSFLDVFFDWGTIRRMPWRPRLQIDLRPKIVLVLLSRLEHQKGYSTLSIALKTSSCWKYTIALSMARPSARLWKGPMAIDSTLRCTWATAHGLRRFIWA